MSVQLIVFPQYFDGSTPLSSPSTEFIVDGINFNQVNTSSSTQSVSGTLPQAFINTYSLHGRSNSPDWGLHLVPFDIKWKVIQQCKEFLKKDLTDNYKLQLNKVIKLLS